MQSEISVIICTKNRPDDLEITLRSLVCQSISPDRLVIIDDGDAEESRQIRAITDSLWEGRIIHIRPEPRSSGLPSARNLGIRSVQDQAGIVLFLDDDVVLEETYLETVRGIFLKYPDVWGVTGYIRNGYQNHSLPARVLLLVAGGIVPALVPVSLSGPRVTRTAEALYPLFRRYGTDVVPAQWLSGCNMAYRSDVFTAGFRFDENLVSYAQGEDMLFSHRLYQDKRKLLLSYNAGLTHRISGKGRIPQFRNLVMMFGYRNYEISRFIRNHSLSSLWYTVFLIQYLLSSIIISLRNTRGLVTVKEVIRAYRDRKSVV